MAPSSLDLQNTLNRRLSAPRLARQHLQIVRDLHFTAAVPLPPLPPSPFNKNPPHRLGGAKEVASTIPMPGLFSVHEPYIRLMYQRRGLKRLASFLDGHLPGGQPPKFVVDQGQKLLGGRGVALLEGGDGQRAVEPNAAGGAFRKPVLLRRA